LRPVRDIDGGTREAGESQQVPAIGVVQAVVIDQVKVCGVDGIKVPVMLEEVRKMSFLFSFSVTGPSLRKRVKSKNCFGRSGGRAF